MKFWRGISLWLLRNVSTLYTARCPMAISAVLVDRSVRWSDVFLVGRSQLTIAMCSCARDMHFHVASVHTSIGGMLLLNCKVCYIGFSDHTLQCLGHYSTSLGSLDWNDLPISGRDMLMVGLLRLYHRHVVKQQWIKIWNLLLASRQTTLCQSPNRDHNPLNSRLRTRSFHYRPWPQYNAVPQSADDEPIDQCYSKSNYFTQCIYW